MSFPRIRHFKILTLIVSNFFSDLKNFRAAEADTDTVFAGLESVTLVRFISLEDLKDRTAPDPFEGGGAVTVVDADGLGKLWIALL
jgi:hypothetical protein